MKYEPAPGSVAFRALAHMELLFKGSEISSAALAAAIGCESSSDLISNLGPAVRYRMIYRRQKGGHVRSPIFWSLVDRSGEAHVAPPPGPQTPLENPARGIDADAARRRESAFHVDPPVTAIQTAFAAALHKSKPGAPAPTPPNLCAHGNRTDGLNACGACLDEETDGFFAGTVLGNTGLPAAPRDDLKADPPSPDIARAMKVRQIRAPARTVEPEQVEHPLRIALWSDGTLEMHASGVQIFTLDKGRTRALIAYLDSISLDPIRDEELA